MEYARAGWTDRQIAGILTGQGIRVSHTTVFRDRAARLKEMAATHPATEEYRNHQLDQTNGLLRAWYPRAVQGDPHAARVALGILERQAKLLGLDAPVRLADADGGNLGPRVSIEAMIQRIEIAIEEAG